MQTIYGHYTISDHSPVIDAIYNFNDFIYNDWRILHSSPLQHSCVFDILQYFIGFTLKHWKGVNDTIFKEINLSQKMCPYIQYIQDNLVGDNTTKIEKLQ